MQTIDFAALEHNALFFKRALGESRLCAVVKNNAYGHGIVHIARFLDSIVDCFAVGSVIEAKQIKFVSKDILILLPQNEPSCEAAIASGHILTCDSFETLRNILKATGRVHMSARVHIKIDSGMSRLGFRFDELPELIFALKNNPQIAVEGAYSHFYGANALDCDKQLHRFLECANALESALNRRLIRHIANSGGALLSPKYHLDMARIGLGLYGYCDENLMPVKTVAANVIAVKKIVAGDVVGYDAKFKADKDMKIAVVNVGYAHGFARSLVGANVNIFGSACRVVAVCMAMIMVDVGDLNVPVGCEVTLLGKGLNQANEKLSVYELLCNLR